MQPGTCLGLARSYAWAAELVKPAGDFALQRKTSIRESPCAAKGGMTVGNSLYTSDRDATHKPAPIWTYSQLIGNWDRTVPFRQASFNGLEMYSPTGSALAGLKDRLCYR